MIILHAANAGSITVPPYLILIKNQGLITTKKIYKRERALHKHFSKQDIQMASKHMKRY